MAYPLRVFSEGTALIGATDGIVKIADSGIFTAGIFGKALLGGRCDPTLAIQAIAYRIVGCGTFSDVYELFKTERECKPWQESQVVQFWRDGHANMFCLGGYGVFFKLRRNIVGMYVNHLMQPYVHVHKLTDSKIWDDSSLIRFLVPRPTIQ